MSEDESGKEFDADGRKISKDAAFMKDNATPNNDQPTVLANSLINFVMTGLTTKFSSIVGSWPVAKLTGRQLLCLTFHVIRTIEEIGFRVERLVGDNAKINVNLFKLLRKPLDEEPFEITHPVDSIRKLFLSYDYTHIIKNVRNQLIDRKLKWDGEEISFSVITSLYEKTLNDRLAICRFLSRKHIAPTNFEKMKVCFARDTFLPEVTASLRTMKDLNLREFENVEKLCCFLEYFWNCYNYHDVCNLTQSTFQRLDIKKPFLDEDDTRLYELDVEIPAMLTHWFTTKKNPMECFTKETLDAIIFTSRSTSKCIKYLLNSGVQFVLTRRFSTENIERFHGSVRNYCGSNDHPSVAQCLSAIDRMNRTQLAFTSMDCNTPLSTEAVLRKKDPLIFNAKNKTCPKQRAIKFLLTSASLTAPILDKFNSHPGITHRQIIKNI